jgi:Rho GTPase-activating protein RGD1
MAASISEEGYPPSWDHADSDHHTSNHGHGYTKIPPTQPYYSRESLDTPLSASISPPRSSAESPTRLTNSRWRDSSIPLTGASNGSVVDTDALPDSNFDETVLHALCETDVHMFDFIALYFYLTPGILVRRAVTSRSNKAKYDILQGT